MKNHHLDEFMNCYLGEWSSQSGYSLTIELLKNNQIPSAIVVGSDPIAIETITHSKAKDIIYLKIFQL